ncbi:MAG: hypothetical protein FWG90_14140 [Oscillospiraceae bacterium]|nr:hypothetical protein [Oscillospiraceae bacterium]
MDVIREIHGAREALINQVNIIFDEFTERAMNGTGAKEVYRMGYESEYRLTSNPAIFKGKKPIAIKIGDERIEVSTWKKVVAAIMDNCNKDAEKHVELMNLRGKIAGRERVILAKTDKGMRSPLVVDENLYLETHYDTETLLRTLMTRVLDVVRYNYNDIIITTRVD